eukprot:5363310-Prymnesium_polylepis.2
MRRQLAAAAASTVRPFPLVGCMREGKALQPASHPPTVRYLHNTSCMQPANGNNVLPLRRVHPRPLQRLAPHERSTRRVPP